MRVLWFNICNKELLALRNNFRVTKKFLIAKFDCNSFLSHVMGLFCGKKDLEFYGHNSTKTAPVFTYTHSYMPTCLRQLLLLPS